MSIAVKRVYEPAAKSDGYRVLVDRVWPRGLKKEDAALDAWAKELAPSTALRKWFAHDPARWSEFQRRYHDELKAQKAALKELAAHKKVTLIFSSHDGEHNNAVALKRELERAQR